MAIASTQLGAAITANQLSFTLTNGLITGAPAVGATPLSMGIPTLIDSEVMYWIAQPVANTMVVRGRGSDGTAATPHDTLSNVYIGPLANDFPLPSPGSAILLDIATDTVVSIGSTSITLTAPIVNTVYNINAPTAAAILLAAPSLASNGVSVNFISNTAAAHVITATGLIRDASGVLRNTATFTANVGASVNFVIENGFYMVDGSPLGVTFA